LDYPGEPGELLEEYRERGRRTRAVVEEVFRRSAPEGEQKEGAG
jgi:hypothetical protein